MIEGLKLAGWSNLDEEDTIGLAERHLEEQERVNLASRGWNELLAVGLGESGADRSAWDWTARL